MVRNLFFYLNSLYTTFHRPKIESLSRSVDLTFSAASATYTSVNECVCVCVRFKDFAKSAFPATALAGNHRQKFSRKYCGCVMYVLIFGQSSICMYCMEIFRAGKFGKICTRRALRSQIESTRIRLRLCSSL